MTEEPLIFHRKYISFCKYMITFGFYEMGNIQGFLRLGHLQRGILWECSILTSEMFSTPLGHISQGLHKDLEIYIHFYRFLQVKSIYFKEIFKKAPSKF